MDIMLIDLIFSILIKTWTIAGFLSILLLLFSSLDLRN